MVIADIAADGAHIFVSTQWRHKDLIKSVPGARWNRDDGLWFVPLSWTSCLALRSTFKTELEIGPSLEAWARAYVNDVITPAMSLRDALTAEGDPDLFEHQRADVQFLVTTRRSLLTNEQGVGKTASAIRTLTELTRRKENVFPALVVCPNSVKVNWAREFERWWPGTNVVVVSGTAAQRRKQLETLKTGRETCPVHHPVTPTETSTPKGSARRATSRTTSIRTTGSASASGTTTQSGDEETLSVSEPRIVDATYSDTSGSPSMSTTSGSASQRGDARSADESTETSNSITAMTQESSVASSADHVINGSEHGGGQQRASAGQTGMEKPSCTCVHVAVMNYESLRSHSRLAPYGSIALRRCVECGGEDARVTTARCDVHERELNKIAFRTVIADELHRAKDPSARQTRALKWVARDAEFRFGLTGTPVANNAIDLWSLLNFIDPVEWPSKTRWVERMVDVTYNIFGGIVVSGIKPEMQAEFERTVYPRMRRMTKAVVLPFLPPIVAERRDVPMTPKQKKAYEQMAEHMIAMLDDEDMLVTTNPMTQAMRLLQLASSYGELEVVETVNEHGDVEMHDRLVLSDPSSKIDAFLDDLDDYEGRSVIVFAVSRQLIMLLSKHLEKKDIAHGLIVGNQTTFDRQQAIDDFQAGRTKMILATVQAGGTGITLTAADTVVYLQRSWSLIDMEQSLARYHRVGSERHESLLRVDYVAPDTFEEVVIARLEGKSAGLEEIVRDKELLAKAVRGVAVEAVPVGD